jgi:hypothetical protein
VARVVKIVESHTPRRKKTMVSAMQQGTALNSGILIISRSSMQMEMIFPQRQIILPILFNLTSMM